MRPSLRAVRLTLVPLVLLAICTALAPATAQAQTKVVMKTLSFTPAQPTTSDQVTFSWAIEAGGVDPGTLQCVLFLDGVQDSTHNCRHGQTVTAQRGPFSEGKHTVRVKVIFDDPNPADNEKKAAFKVVDKGGGVLPDFVPGSIDLSDNTLALGQQVTIGFEPRNDGPGTTASVPKCGIWVDGVPLSDGNCVDGAPFQATGGPYAIGTHQVEVVVDDSDLIPETDETNNSTTTTFDVEGPVDIRVMSITDVTGATGPAQVVTEICAVGAPAGFTLRIGASAPGCPPFGTSGGDGHISWLELTPDSCRQDTWVLSGADLFGELVGAWADTSTPPIPESSLGNNIACTTIVDRAAADTDLAIQSIDVDDESSRRAGQATITVQIAEGERPDKTPKCAIYANGEAVSTRSCRPGDTLQADVDVSDEEPLEWVEAAIDTRGKITEADEANNRLSTLVGDVERTTDLTVRHLDADVGKDDVLFTYVVCNQGRKKRKTTLRLWSDYQRDGPATCDPAIGNSQSIDLTLPSEECTTGTLRVLGLAKGRNTAMAVIDPQCKIRERDETNNWIKAQYRVKR